MGKIHSFRSLSSLRPQQVLHDIATPLTNVLWDLEQWHEHLSRTPLDISPGLRAEDVATALDQLKRATSLLQDYSRDCHDQESTLFSPRQVVQSIIDNFHKGYLVDCQCHLDVSSQELLYGSPQAFGQIVTHLLNNAAESYCSLRVHRPVIVYLTRGMRGLVLAISDRGQGMNRWQLFRVTHPLTLPFIGEITWSFKPFKSGLGLSQVRRLLHDKFSGFMDFTSYPALGTTVMVYFPLGD